MASSSLSFLVRLLEPGISPFGVAAGLLVLGLPDRVPYEGIERVAAGMTYRIDASGRQCRDEHVFSGEPIDAREPALQALQTSIHGAVGRAARGATKVGVLFSGGLDSSAVLAALVEHVDSSRIVAVTWDLGGTSNDDAYVRAWESRLGLQVQRVTVAEAAPLLLDSLVLGAAPTSLMTGAFERAAMRRVKERGADVLLTGVGGDETFAGPIQAAIRDHALVPRWFQRALFAELPWASTWRNRVSELVVRPLLRPVVPRPARERLFHARMRRRLPELAPVVDARLREAASLHVAANPPVPTTVVERHRELTRRPFWLEIGELRAQLEEAGGISRFDIPLDAEVHRTVARIAPRWLFSELRHRGLLRRVLQGRAPQIVTARYEKAIFDAFGSEMLRAPGIVPRLRGLAEGRALARFGLIEPGALARRFGRLGAERLGDVLEQWSFLTAEAFLEDRA